MSEISSIASNPIPTIISTTVAEDLPVVVVRWFHAVDFAKKDNTPFKTKPVAPVTTKQGPTQWAPFNAKDSAALETTYQTWLKSKDASKLKPGRSIEPVKTVPVNEDWLFEVDVEKKELYPVYWPGPIYEVRRGTWFCALDGSKFVPCDDNLSKQLEDGYRKFQPWKNIQQQPVIPSTTSTTPATTIDTNQSSLQTIEEKRWSLLGPYLNQYVIYSNTNEKQAWLLSDMLTSKLARALMSKLTNSENLGGTRLARGYDEVLRLTMASTAADATRLTTQMNEDVTVEEDELSATVMAELNPTTNESVNTPIEATSPMEWTPNSVANETFAYDTKEVPIESSGERQIDHLIFVIHGIGQRLGARLENISAVHDCNILRKMLKACSAQIREQLQQSFNASMASSSASSALVPPINSNATTNPALTAPSSSATTPIASASVSPSSKPKPPNPTTPNIAIPAGSGVQVLPVQWRHQIEFEKRMRRMQRRAQKRKTQESTPTTTAPSKPEDIIVTTSTTESTTASPSSPSGTSLKKSKSITRAFSDFFVTKPTSPQQGSSELSAKPNPTEKLESSSKDRILPPENPNKPIEADPDADSSDLSDEEEDEILATLEDVTLDGVPSIRALVSDVVLDVLLYMDPTHRQSMITAVTNELNQMYKVFLKRHPNFKGKVSIFGHSLGSLLAFDILCNQWDAGQNVENRGSMMNASGQDLDLNSPGLTTQTSVVDEVLGFGSGAGKREGVSSESNQKKFNLRTTRVSRGLVHSDGVVRYSKLKFDVDTFFAVGSPIGLFMLLQGRRLRARKLEDAKLPSYELLKALEDDRMENIVRPACRKVYNLFHPHDPVAYRIEPHIHPNLAQSRAAVIPYTKGGLKGSILGIQGMSTDLADKGKNMLGSMFSSVMSLSSALAMKKAMPILSAVASTTTPSESSASPSSSKPQPASDIQRLNPQGRIDYSLQEGVLENPYLSALAVHMNYWSDQDVATFILREMFN